MQRQHANVTSMSKVDTVHGHRATMSLFSYLYLVWILGPKFSLAANTYVYKLIVS